MLVLHYLDQEMYPYLFVALELELKLDRLFQAFETPEQPLARMDVHSSSMRTSLLFQARVLVYQGTHQ